MYKLMDWFLYDRTSVVKALILYILAFQNGKTNFKNLSANAARFLKCV